MTTPSPTPPPDRIRIAQLGLALIAVSSFFGNAPVIGLLPAIIAFFLPRFRVLGWWLTVVLVLVFTTITAGGAVFLARNWSTAAFEARNLAILSAVLMSLMLVGCAIAFVGLLSRGTRNAVELRTLEIAPHAFDSNPVPPKPRPPE